MKDVLKTLLSSEDGLCFFLKVSACADSVHAIHLGTPASTGKTVSVTTASAKTRVEKSAEVRVHWHTPTCTHTHTQSNFEFKNSNSH